MIPRTRSYHDIYPAESSHTMKDWRTAISTPLTYRIGNSTVQFRYQILFVGALITLAVFVLFYVTQSGNTRSNFVSVKHWERTKSWYNDTYPLTPVVKLEQSSRFRIAVVADLDTASKKGDSWISYLQYGYLTITDNRDKVSISWDINEVELKNNLAAGGRGLELSELQVFNGKLYSVDDRTGVIYQIVNDRIVPWVILSDGNGIVGKGFKAEWCAVKSGSLIVGGLGKEWTTSTGEILNHDPMWVKIVSVDGAVKHADWREKYTSVRHAAGISWPGYMIHEAVGWSHILRKWFFLPRRMSGERYNDVTDEKMGTNLMITADETFKDIKVNVAGLKIPTHGFSSFKFVPGTKDTVIVALKSEEFEGKVATYIMVFNTEGVIIYPETKIGNRKFEGFEFV